MEIGCLSLRQRILRIDDDSDDENNRNEINIHADAMDELVSDVENEHFDDGGETIIFDQDDIEHHIGERSLRRRIQRIHDTTRPASPGQTDTRIPGSQVHGNLYHDFVTTGNHNPMDVLPEEPGETFFRNFFSYSSYSCQG